MSPMMAILARDLRLASRRPAEALLPVVFFVVVLLLGAVHDHLNQGTDVSAFAKKVQQQQQQSAVMTAPPAAPAANRPAAAATNTLQLLSTPNAPATTPASTPAKPN